MLALVYLGLAIALGDLLCRRFFRFVSVPHRCAAATLVGMLVSAWFTYLTALAFAYTAEPLVWANLASLTAAAAMIVWLSKKPSEGSIIEPRAPGSPIWDWVTLAIYFAATCWLMFSTLNFSHGDIQVARKALGDLGPNMAIQQSFAVGHNFPPQYPLFPGERMRYHFLFYFAAGNLEFLGLHPAMSLNLLSVLSMTSLLALVMAFGELLFRSRAVGRIGSALFFFTGSFSFIAFVASQSSLSNAIHAVMTRKEFLQSGYRYAGEDWAIWTMNVFTNQRHLAGAIGIFLIVLIFLTDRYRLPVTNKSNLFETPNILERRSAASLIARISRGAKNIFAGGKEFIFAGFLLGALPFWNPPVFVGGLAVLLFLFLLFPYRQYMIGLALTAAAVALPQIWYLRPGSSRPRGYSLFHWGYVVDNPTVIKVASYLGFTFGAKWVLIILALACVSWFHRRVFIAVSSLLLVTFFFRFSGQLAANHKFLNVWLIIANLFVAYALYWLWKLKTPWRMGQAVATILIGFIVAGGVIDVFPFHNDYYINTPYLNDQLVKWVLNETDPRAIFLTERFFSHPILLAGRSLFYGWPIYAGNAGYDTGSREVIYRELFESRDPKTVFRLLKENHITYVAFDDGVRHSDVIKRPNEEVYARYFSKAFDDKEHKYSSLTIYKVPEISASQFDSLPQIAANMFEGGMGSGKGEFYSPRGMAADMNGNIFVADTNNGRIEKFSPTGAFLSAMGTKGTGYGQLDTPNGIAIDRLGNIYVADASRDCIEKLASNGNVIAEWTGPDPGFYGPRRIAIGPDDSIYVVDQGRNRIVKFNPAGGVLAAWGSGGSDDGQFNDPTSVTVDPATGKVFVADPINRRIQVFDSNGTFLTKWSVFEWGQPHGFEDMAIDSGRGRLYASSANMNTILVFDVHGHRLQTLSPKASNRLEGPSAIVLAKGKLFILNTSSARVSVIDLQNR